MAVTIFKNKPPQKDWAKYVCRFNVAKALSATKHFTMPFYPIRIVWDKAGGYPEHSWGYIQYSVRPVYPGFGCDGTTDTEHHARAVLILLSLGLDPDRLFAEAHPDRADVYRPTEALKYVSPGKDFIPPAAVPGPKDIQNMLYDLYQLNQRSYVQKIVETLERKGIDVPDYNEPSERVQELVVPKSGMPLKIQVRVDSNCNSNRTREYFLNDGSVNLVLFQESLIRGNKGYLRGYWWDDPKVLARLERISSIKDRCQYAIDLIMRRQAPEKYWNTQITLSEIRQKITRKTPIYRL